MKFNKEERLIFNSRMREFREDLTELWRYLDSKDRIVIGLLVILTLVAVSIQSFVSFNPLVALTAISIFFVYMRVRNQQSGSYPEYARIVPHFSDKNGGEGEIFGLKNFGGPGLNLRVYARVKIESGVFDANVIKNHETVHLERDGFVPLLTQKFTNEQTGESESLLDPNSKLHDRGSNIELYYTFESVSGRDHPENLKQPSKMKMEEIVERYDSKQNWVPQEVRLEEIKERAVCEQNEN